MVLVAPRSAKLVETRGARFTLLCGYVFLLLAFVTMLLLWEEGIPYWKVGLAYAFIGIGVGFAGTPASHSLTGSVPVRRAGMASGTADLQRDLGGAIMQSIFGALLTAGYAAAAAAAIAAAPNSAQITDERPEPADEVVRRARRAVAQQYPQYASQITAAAKQSFLDGASGRTRPGLIAVALGRGARVVHFPEERQEQRLSPPTRPRTTRSAARRAGRRGASRVETASRIGALPAGMLPRTGKVVPHLTVEER